MLTFGEAGPRRVTLRHRKHAILLSTAGAGREGPEVLNDPGSDVSDDGSAGQTPGHWPGTRDAADCPGGAVPTRHRRALLLAVLVLGAWALLVAWSSAARADEPAPAPACAVALPPADNPATDAPAEPPVAATALCPAPSEADPPTAPAAEPPALPVAPIEPVAPPAPAEPSVPPATPRCGPGKRVRWKCRAPAAPSRPWDVPAKVPVDLPVVEAAAPAPPAVCDHNSTVLDPTGPTPPPTPPPPPPNPGRRPQAPGPCPRSRQCRPREPRGGAGLQRGSGVPRQRTTYRPGEQRIRNPWRRRGAPPHRPPATMLLHRDAPRPAARGPPAPPVPLSPLTCPTRCPHRCPRRHRPRRPPRCPPARRAAVRGRHEQADLPYAVLGGGFAATDAQASVRPTQGLRRSRRRRGRQPGSAPRLTRCSAPSRATCGSAAGSASRPCSGGDSGIRSTAIGSSAAACPPRGRAVRWSTAFRCSAAPTTSSTSSAGTRSTPSPYCFSRRADWPAFEK